MDVQTEVVVARPRAGVAAPACDPDDVPRRYAAAAAVRRADDEDLERRAAVLTG